MASAVFLVRLAPPFLPPLLAAAVEGALRLEAVAVFFAVGAFFLLAVLAVFFVDAALVLLVDATLVVPLAAEALPPLAACALLGAPRFLVGVAFVAAVFLAGAAFLALVEADLGAAAAFLALLPPFNAALPESVNLNDCALVFTIYALSCAFCIACRSAD